MKTRNKIYILLIIFTTISLILILFLIYPTLTYINNGSQEILSYKKESILIDLENKELDNFKKKYKEYELNFKKIDQLFVDSKNPVEFVKFLENTAYHSSLKPNVNLLQSSKSGVIVFSINVKGDFSSILTFSKKLETGPYLITIQSLSIKKSEAEVEAETDKEKMIHQVEANFSIEVIANEKNI